MHSVLASRYRMKNAVGAGTFGSVFVCDDTQTQSEVALKVQTDPVKSAQLRTEAEVYTRLTGAEGFPAFFGTGVDKDTRYIALELLGKSIRVLTREQSKKLSLKTCLMLFDQMIARVEYLHRKGYVHRDLKPSNFLIGTGAKSNTLYLIDFGLCLRYVDIGGAHKGAEGRTEFAGTPIFASINSMNGGAISRRDDMQSLGYIFVYMMLGTLPWKSCATSNKSESFNAIRATKMATSVTELCSMLPSEFLTYMNAVMNLKYEEKPDYAGYRRMFRDLFVRSNFIYDYRYDWLSRLRPQVSFTGGRRQMFLAEGAKNRSASPLPSRFIGMHPREMMREGSEKHLRLCLSANPIQSLRPPTKK